MFIFASGQYECVKVILNFLPLAELEYFTKLQGILSRIRRTFIICSLLTVLALYEWFFFLLAG